VRDLVLIAGGYGEVGARLASHLARACPDRVVVAGRSLERARAAVAALGGRASARAVDVNDPASIERALDGVATVVCCVEQDERRTLLRAAATRGLAYTDLTASSIWRAALALRGEAEASGARIVLGAGLVPGISSAMARAAADRVGPLESVETDLLLCAGDAFGPDSLSYLMRELAAPLVVTERGRERTVACFSEPRVVAFPDPVGARIARRAPFADQYFFPRSFGVATATTCLAIDPPWTGAVIAAALRGGVARLLDRAWFRGLVRGLVATAKLRPARSDSFALVVEAVGKGGSARFSLVGRGQAQATAIAASLLTRALVDREIEKPGVWFAEQVVDPERFFADLRREGLVVRDDGAAAP
jgi:saccharopine dehydrogenase-like NADP-dependent oxidoreductase